MNYLEDHYSPLDLAKRWRLSTEVVRDLFRSEDGVIVILRPETLKKRSYSTIRIPAKVAQRVYERLMSKQFRQTRCAA